MTSEEGLREEVAIAVQAARARGARTFYEVLSQCEGADPLLVESVLGEAAQKVTGPSYAMARRETSELAALFPAANPVACQWWFTLDSIEQLAHRIAQIVTPESRVAFLGTPTVGYQFSRQSSSATVFEFDPNVVQALQSAGARIVSYDVAEPLPDGHAGNYRAVLVDPPWQDTVLRAFLARALELAETGASVLSSLPPRLTRPGIIQERQALLSDLLKADVEVVAVERAAMRYLVPGFESVVLQPLVSFDGRPWRTGDLLHVRKKDGSCFSAPPLAPTSVSVHARDPREYRVFLRRSVGPARDEAAWVSRALGFESTLSHRKFDPAALQWWTSEKRGGTVRDPDLVEKALRHWAEDRLNLDRTVDRLREGGLKRDSARALCQELDDHLDLWKRHGKDQVTVRPDLATETAGQRPYPKAGEDGYRKAFQRDRDRITWSRGLRQLANKTQVFPIGSGDFLRNRLSHSLEVMQLASTIGASFGLNLNLIEAGALAHDIGHTPFGHAGEEALHDLFRDVKSTLGFSHYEHGVDVVRWLEDAYQSPSLGGLFGLNLTPEVAECIFKHTYCTQGGDFCQEELYRRSKHKAYFSNDLCHVEGQAVRIADKVSYLISDLEDGIRVGALSLDDLLRCRLLRRSPLDLVPGQGESQHERFLSQRSLIIGVLMEDIIEATAQRLASIKSLQEVRKLGRYTVDHSEQLRSEVGEVWSLLQAGKLHRDSRVQLANLKAKGIVRELTLLFTFFPLLVDERFRQGHERLRDSEYMNFYRGETGNRAKLTARMLQSVVRDGDNVPKVDPKNPEVPVEDLVQAKDFVAGLSDERARSLHREYLS